MSQSLPSLLKGLNKPQSEAVSYDAGSLAVIAGAGSGKTKVLTNRIAYLLTHHQWPSHAIMAVTFTNKAAQEMKKRLHALQVPHVDQMWVGTFHGLAYRFLRLHHDAAGLSKHFQIIDPQEQEKILKKIFKANHWDQEGFDVKEALSFINQQKDAGIRPHKAESGAYGSFVLQAYREYQEACDKNSWVDFGELLLRCYEVTCHHPEILLHYQNKFRHILVDEFQDTNDIQYAWIEKLCDKGMAIPATVVGDMDQSIYSWRGAKMKNVERFVDEFAQAQLVKLEQNYRSTHHILACANALIGNNKERIPKNLWTQQNTGDPVVLFEAYDDKEEADWAVTQAVKEFGKSKKWGNCAILYRSNAQSRILEEACIKRNVPYKIHGGQRFFERAEIKDALAHLHVISNIKNDLMLERALTSPSKGFGAKTLDLLRHHSQVEDVSWSTLLDRESFGKTHLTPKTRAAWSTWRDAWAEQHDTTLEERVRWCVEKTGLLAHYQEMDRKEKTDRGENLKEFVSVAKRYQESYRQPKEYMIEDFLASIALESDKDDQQGDAVNLMTIHASKGLEFPQVCLVGWDDGIFPSGQSLSDQDRMEEERRLAYVAITRAETRLCISGTVMRRQYGQVMQLPPSRFFAELPVAHCVWLRQPQRQYKTAIHVPTMTSPLLQGGSRNDGFWKVGELVEHPLFGRGKILRVDGAGKNDRVVVQFTQEKKVLLPQLAKLQKV